MDEERNPSVQPTLSLTPESCSKRQIILIHIKDEIYNVGILLFRTWTTAFEASEPREKGHVAVVFGSTEDILRSVQVADDINVTSTLQWVLVPLGLHQDLSSLGESNLISKLRCFPHTTAETCN
jgi:hypothetical protein